jgi:Mg2+ and Co2+ transporter CorA
LLYEATKNTLEFSVAKRAEQQARSSYQMEVAAHRLNLLAAFFFPVATLTAIFGVNLKHGLESYPPPWGFMTIIAIGLALGAVLAVFVSRRRPERPTRTDVPRDLDRPLSKRGTPRD